MEFTDANFDKEVLKSNIPVLIDFWAPWCGPCQRMLPLMEELAHEVEGKSVKVCKMNVDENPNKDSEYGIMSIPAIKIFKGGKVIKEFVGVQNMDVLKSELEKSVVFKLEHNL